MKRQEAEVYLRKLTGRAHVGSIVALLGCAILSGCGGQTLFSGQLNVAGDPPPLAPKPQPRVEVRDNKIEIHEKIQFEYNKSNIKEESYGLLDEVVTVIRDNPHIRKIAIEGHASSEGEEDFNKRLSDARAKSVRSYLTEHGIEDGMLTAQGFGEERPIADNETESGREKNRRVEFNIIEQEVTKKTVEIDPETGKEKLLDKSKKTLGQK